MKKRIAIIGSNFAGYTTAVTLAKLLRNNHEIVVIDKKPEFFFLPSFVWHPFGYRNKDDISFDTRPIYDDLGVYFKKATVYGFELDDQLIYTAKEDIPYDYLVIATGSRPRYEGIRGLRPGINASSICNLTHAMQARDAWKKFLANPGPMVIGAAQWAGYFFAAYEFLLNAVYHLKQKKLLNKVPIHFVTPEPYLGHFGIGGLYKDHTICNKLFEDYDIKAHTNAEIHEIKQGEVVLEDGAHLESAFSMIIPQFVGVNAVKTTRRLGDVRGLIDVNEEFSHPVFPNVYAAGGAVHIPQLDETPVPLGVPRTHSSSEIMAKAVAYNVASAIEGGVRISVTTPRIYEYCRSDMDYLGLMLFSDKAKEKASLDFIAKGSQEKWANLEMKKYIESSFNEDYLRI